VSDLIRSGAVRSQLETQNPALTTPYASASPTWGRSVAANDTLGAERQEPGAAQSFGACSVEPDRRTAPTGAHPSQPESQGSAPLPHGVIAAELDAVQDVIAVAHGTTRLARRSHRDGYPAGRADALARVIELLTEALARAAELAERTAGGAHA